MPKTKGLTPKEQDFVIFYNTPDTVEYHNGKRAYMKAYPNASEKTAEVNSCIKLRNTKIRTANSKYVADSMAKAGRTVQSIDIMQQKAYDLAMKINQPSAAVSAGTAIARLYGMDKDAGTGKDSAPVPISPEDLPTLKAIAEALTAKELSGPHLAAEGA